MPTEEKWDKMRDEKQINIQTLACLHDAVALTIATAVHSKKEGMSLKKAEQGIKYWLDTLYNIAETFKAEITTPKPVDLDKAEALGDKWKKDRIEEERIRIGAKYQEKEEEIPIIEEKI